MNSAEIFGQALQLSKPWFVKEVRLETDDEKANKTLHLYLDFEKGGVFKDAEGNNKKAYDTLERSWQHLNFFQHRCYIHARVPRIEESDGKVKQVEVSWARPNSGFTLLFEAFTMLLIESEMPVNKAASVLNVYANRLWNIFNYWISRAYNSDIQKDIKRIGIDETSTRKGHNYVTVAVDLDTRRVIKASEGKGSECIEEIAHHMDFKGSASIEVEQICIDMSPAFISGCMTHFPKAAITFDKFHIVKEINKALDETRKIERKEFDMLKGHKYVLLKNEKKLNPKERIAKDDILEFMPSMAKAFQLKELFYTFWELSDIEEAESYLAYWCDLAVDSGIRPFIKASNTLKLHWSGIVNYIKSKINNGILEGINSKIQLAKRRARGYHNIQNFINMIYFICGKLKFDYPHYST